MQRGVFHLALVASLAAPAAAQPSSQPAVPAKWLVHDASDRCVATHEYKVDGHDWIVGIEPRPTSDETSLLLLAPVGASDLRQANVRVGGIGIATSRISLDVNDPSGRHLYRVPLTSAELAGLSSNGSIQIQDVGRTVNIPVANVGQVHQYLDSCVQTLLENWGLPADKQATVASFPAIDRQPTDYVSSQERNTVRIRPGMNADATVVLQVQSNGAANDCVVIHSTGDAAVDARTCKIFVERARYRPARDRSGQPIRAPLLASLSWGRP
jgi:hypothetical protein